MESAAYLSGVISVLIMLVVFGVLYLALLRWWKATNRLQQALRAGLWAVAILTPFTIGPALGMDAERGIKGVVILMPAFFICGAVLGGIYSLTPLYKNRAGRNA